LRTGLEHRRRVCSTAPPKARPPGSGFTDSHSARRGVSARGRHRARMRTISLRARLTVWYTLALFVVLCVFGVDVIWQQGRIGVRRVDRELSGVLTTLENVLTDELTENADPGTAATEARKTIDAPGRTVAILDDRGTVLAGSLGGLQVPDILSNARDGARSW